MTFTTYAIADPDSKLVVYIGQTTDFERRKREHLSTHRLRKSPPKKSIKHWLWKTQKEGREPVFVALDTVISEAESLASETRWVETFAVLGHPLHNRWSEHVAAMLEAKPEDTGGLYEVYWPGRWRSAIAEMVPTGKGRGFTVTFPKEATVKEGGRLVVLPKRRG